VPGITQLRLQAASQEGLGWVDSLVERARTGDLAAFEQLAEQHMPDAYRLAVAMVGADDARDVTQDALVAAWRRLPSLRESARFDSWLRSIVMNRARNALRSRRRHATVTFQEEHAAWLVDEPITDVNMRLALESAFANVSLEHRAVLVLHYLVDLPLREVADILGLREGTAKSRLHGGLKALRGHLRDRSL
jgi:RNA polymerase sigma-70 factor (ECF subfamily)